MNILDQFKMWWKYEETIQNLVQALLAFRTVFLMNQRTIVSAILHTSYKNPTSAGLELSTSFVDFELQC